MFFKTYNPPAKCYLEKNLILQPNNLFHCVARQIQSYNLFWSKVYYLNTQHFKIDIFGRQKDFEYITKLIFST